MGELWKGEVRESGGLNTIDTKRGVYGRGEDKKEM